MKQGLVPIEVEVLPVSVAGTLERAEIDVQIATARAYPRSLEQFQKRALSMATLDEETAESCIYQRPVGDGKIAEGASIRLAEIVAASYGNLRVASRLIEQTERFVKCEGVAIDLESNYAGKSEVIEPTVTKEGRPYSERQRAVVAKAALAKAYRDATFKVIPRSVCKSIIDAAKKVAAGDEKTIDSRKKRAQDWLKLIKVDDSRAFRALGVQGWSDVGVSHLLVITGLRTAINDGDTTVDEAFPGLSIKQANTGAAPKTFTVGSGEVPETPKKVVPENLILLRKNMVASNIEEKPLLELGRATGMFDESLNSLEEVSEMQPKAIDAANSGWKSILKTLKK
jgi:hypothetical protein